MNQALNTAWIGFGWAEDISVQGSRATDTFTVTVHRANRDGRAFSWTGAADEDGTIRVRVGGEETSAWTAGVLPVSLKIQRGDAAGIIADLPRLVVKVPAVAAGGTNPLLGDRRQPLRLRLDGSDGAPLHVTLAASTKGDKGAKGDTGDLTPELVGARDLAVLSAQAAREDASATAADRVATAADRTQVRADQIDVADDRLRTAADRVATGADRSQTGQDRAETTALRSETETLRDSASGHRAAAQAAATASQGNRDATEADRVQTGQDRTQTGQDRTAAANAATQTAADRVQTGQDRTAAANSAAVAASYDPAPFNAHLGNTADPHQSSAQAQDAVRGGVASAYDTLKKVYDWALAQFALKANLASPALTGNPTAATQAAGNNSTRLSTTAFVMTAVANAIAALTKASVGLGNVDNTSDANKPVSTAQQSALDAKMATTSANAAYVAQARRGAAVAISQYQQSGYTVTSAQAGSFLSEIWQSNGDRSIQFPSSRPMQVFYNSTGTWVTVSG